MAEREIPKYFDAFRTVEVGSLIVEFSQRLVLKNNGEIVELSPSELSLLAAISPNKYKKTPDIAQMYEFMRYGDVKNTINPQDISPRIHALRQKIEVDPQNPTVIINDFGFGYKIGGKDLEENV